LQRHGPGPFHLARAPRLGNAARKSEAELAKALDAAKTEKLGLWQAD
jgi:endonuclease YncB( thermonuclease family)